MWRCYGFSQLDDFHFTESERRKSPGFSTRAFSTLMHCGKYQFGSLRVCQVRREPDRLWIPVFSFVYSGKPDSTFP
ncbi:hypothetical protein FB480_103542 [Agrobacterium vitis]|nr:hypothetical protein FB480_103542 [Agrobacterium vitis]